MQGLCHLVDTQYMVTGIIFILHLNLGVREQSHVYVF